MTELIGKQLVVTDEPTSIRTLNDMKVWPEEGDVFQIEDAQEPSPGIWKIYLRGADGTPYFVYYVAYSPLWPTYFSVEETP